MSTFRLSRTIQLSHQTDTCACPAWSLGHSLLVMLLEASVTLLVLFLYPQLPTSLRVSTPLGHSPEVSYTRGSCCQFPSLLYLHDSKATPRYDCRDHFLKVPALQGQLHWHL